MFRSDANDLIEGLVLELMFEQSTESYVYRYEDLISKATDYIGVMDLETEFCEWKNISAVKEGVFVAVQDVAVVINTRKIDKLKAVKSTDAAKSTGNGIVAVQDKTTSTNEKKLLNKKIVDAKSDIVPNKRIKGAHHMVYGPTTSIFDAELLEEGVKRNRQLKK